MLRPLRSPTWASVRPRDWRQRRTSRPTGRRGGRRHVFPQPTYLTSGRMRGRVCPEAIIDLPTTNSQGPRARSGHGPQAQGVSTMKIAVIGTGNVGSALGGAFARAGHEVDLRRARRGQGGGRRGEAPGPARPASSTRSRRSDVVVLAIPYGCARRGRDGDRAGRRGQGRRRRHQPARRRTTRASPTPAIGPAPSRPPTSCPGANVVKAFNTLFAQVQAEPGAPRHQARRAVSPPTTTTRPRRVGELASSIGFRPVHVGPLAASRELEALAWLNIRLQMVASGNWQTLVRAGRAARGRRLAA